MRRAWRLWLRQEEIVMPFKSEKQRKYLYAKKPKLASKWAKKYGSTVRKKK
jgi:hypothetical protein